MAPYLLHWQAITDAQAKQLRSYDFGGSETAGGASDLGFNRFKVVSAGSSMRKPSPTPVTNTAVAELVALAVGVPLVQL